MIRKRIKSNVEDRFGRTIEYLRLSVTDRCNLRCRYCMPPGGADFVKHEDMLTYEEILRIIRILAGEGLAKVRLTGGEPTMRKGITGLIKGIHRISGIREIALTTNGLNFADMGSDLARAGVNCVNFSLDALEGRVPCQEGHRSGAGAWDEGEAELRAGKGTQ